MTFGGSIRHTASSTGYFILGFLCGTLLDLLFSVFYKKLDPVKPGYHTRLLILVIIQLFMVVSILSLILNIKERTSGQTVIYMFMMHIGVVTSQFYLFDYISKYVESYLVKFPLRTPREIQVFNDPKQRDKNQSLDNQKNRM